MHFNMIQISHHHIKISTSYHDIISLFQMMNKRRSDLMHFNMMQISHHHIKISTLYHDIISLLVSLIP